MFFITIKSRSDFVKLNKDCDRFYSDSTVVLAKRTPEKYLVNPRTGKPSDFCRIGYTITKRVSKLAVVRNRLKRRYREAFRLAYKEYALNCFDYVVVAKKEAVNSDFTKIVGDLKFCLRRIKKISKHDQSRDEQSGRPK